MRRKEKETELRFEETRRCSQRANRGKEKTSQERGEDQRKGKGEKERESGKGVDGDGVEFGMIESERSEDLHHVIAVICDDDVVVLIDRHSHLRTEMTEKRSR